MNAAAGYIYRENLQAKVNVFGVVLASDRDGNNLTEI